VQNFQKSEVDAATGTAEGAGLLDGFTGSSGEQQTEILGGWRTKQAKHEPDGAVHQAASIYHGHYSVLMTL